MKTKYYYLLAGLLLPLAGCSDNGPSDGRETKETPINIELTRSEENAVKSVNDFSFDMMRALENRYSQDNPNYIISPQGAAWCIAMMANGATPGSETEREMIDVLKLGENSTIDDVNEYSSKLISAVTSKERKANVQIANAVYYKDNIMMKSGFVDRLKTFYNVNVFENPTNDVLNGWISGQTGGLIQDFAQNAHLEDLDFGVLNTLLFNANWDWPFKEENTELRDFRNADGTISKTPLMNARKSADMSQDDVCHYLKILYYGRSFAINFVIPTEGHTIDDVKAHLTNERIANLESTATYGSNYDIMIPKMSLANYFDLKDVISDMGVRKAFSGSAELSGISSEDIMLTRYDQSSRMTFDETGTKIVVVSHSGGGSTAAGPSGFFHLDEPFYFFITEESTGAILFLGKVSQL